MGVYDQIKTAFQDIIAPELQALRGEIRRLDQRIESLDQEIDAVDARLDTLRVEGLSMNGVILARSDGSTPGSTASTASFAPRSMFASGSRRWRPAGRPEAGPPCGPASSLCDSRRTSYVRRVANERCAPIRAHCYRRPTEERTSPDTMVFGVSLPHGIRTANWR